MLATAAPAPSVSDLLRAVRVADAQTAGGLQVFGLWHDLPPALGYLTLDDALESHSMTVTEVSEGGNVPTLKVVNASGARVFLMAGEQLVGAKQNRVLNTSLMVAPEAELPVPVSCVEQGRWAYRRPDFGSTGTASHARLRAQMNKQANDSYVSLGYAACHQREVWAEVSDKLTKMGSRSDSTALEQTYVDHRRKIDDAFGRLTCPENSHGVAFARNGRIIGVDLFDKPQTLAKLWPKLLRSHAIDALESPDADATPLTATAVADWLAAAAAVEPKPFPSAGLGQDLRLENDKIVGAALAVDENPVHVQLFALGA
jgi:hypothetical protein